MAKTSNVGSNGQVRQSDHWNPYQLMGWWLLKSLKGIFKCRNGSAKPATSYLLKKGGPGNSSRQSLPIAMILSLAGFCRFPMFSSVSNQLQESSQRVALNRGSIHIHPLMSRNIFRDNQAEASTQQTTNSQLRVRLNQEVNTTHPQFPEPGSLIFWVFVSRPGAKISYEKTIVLETKRFLRCQFVWHELLGEESCDLAISLGHFKEWFILVDFYANKISTCLVLCF